MAPGRGMRPTRGHKGLGRGVSTRPAPTAAPDRPSHHSPATPATASGRRRVVLTGSARATPSQVASTGRPTIGRKGIAMAIVKRSTRKLHKDAIRGVTKGDLRRLARRGGVKRIASEIYDTMRDALIKYLRPILADCSAYTEHANRRTITVDDVIFALKRRGRPIYGFDKDTYNVIGKRKRRY